MIVCDIRLLSAVTGEDTQLGLLIIDNQGSYDGGKTADYRARMYRKGTKLFKNEGPGRTGWSFAHGTNPKPIRTGMVRNHKRVYEPVQNLILKTLKELGYD